MMLILVPALVSGQSDNPVREVDALTSQWTDLEHQSDTIEANWRTQQPVLEQQLSLLDRETRELTEYLAGFEQQQDEVEQRRLELAEEQTELEREQDALDGALAQISRELRRLGPQLPPPLAVSWTDDLARFENGLLTNTEKLQLALQLLGQLDDFEQKITLNVTVMALSDGAEYEVHQVYLGLSHGWYVTSDGQFAAAGTAGPDGWRWTPVMDARPISDIVAILERRSEPQLISIPLALNATAAAGGN
jgi:hypothetical protein